MWQWIPALFAGNRVRIVDTVRIKATSEPGTDIGRQMLLVNIDRGLGVDAVAVAIAVPTGLVVSIAQGFKHLGLSFLGSLHG